MSNTTLEVSGARGASRAPVETRPRVALVTNFCPHYRLPLFEELARRVDLTLLLTSRGEEWYWEGERPTATAGLRVVHTPDVRAIAAELRRSSYDAVVGSLTGRATLAATVLTARRLRLPFVLWVGIWEHPRTLAHRLTRPVVRGLYRSADAVVTYGTHVSTYIARESGRTRDVFVARQSVDNEHFRTPASAVELGRMRTLLGAGGIPTFLFVGRLTVEKGLEHLVEASARASAPHRIAIAGSGPLLEATKAHVLVRGIDARVRLLGHVGQHELPALLQASDVLVLPSVTTPTFREPWGLVVNEAMNAGLPVVATTAVGAAPGGLVLHGETGLVVPERDPKRLAEAIDSLAVDAATRRRLGDAAKAHVLGWNYDVAADAFEQAVAAAKASMS